MFKIAYTPDNNYVRYSLKSWKLWCKIALGTDNYDIR